jgi:hypothetical protein
MDEVEVAFGEEIGSDGKGAWFLRVEMPQLTNNVIRVESSSASELDAQDDCSSLGKDYSRTSSL